MGWTLPSDADDIVVCAVEYRPDGSDNSDDVPVEKTQPSLVLSDLERNTLYEIRLYCLYENIPGPTTEWFRVSTRTGLFLLLCIQQTHTSHQRRYNIVTLQQRYNDVVYLLGTPWA